MIDIAYIVSHGFALRMITQTGLLIKLIEQGKKIAVIAPDKNDPTLIELANSYGIEVHEFNVKGKFTSDNYMFKRKYFLEDIQDNPALMDKHIHATRYNTSKHPVRILRPYYYWLIYKIIPYFGFIRQRFVKNEKKYLHSNSALELISRLKPKKLVATYPVSFNEAVLLYYGNQNPDIETWIHLLSWDNITCKGRWPAVAKKYIAWGPVMKDELVEYYNVKENDISECGVPHFDLHVKSKQQANYRGYLESLSLNPDEPYLFFAMSSPRFAPREIDIVEWLSKKIADGAFGYNMQFVVRPHPQNITGNLADKTWLPRLKALNTVNRTAIDMPAMVKSKLSWSMQQNDMERFSQLLSGSSIVLNSGSTVSIDALVMDKPVILTSFDAEMKLPYWKSAQRLIDYPHLQKLLASGGVRVTRSFDELVENIDLYLLYPGTDSTERLKAKNLECAILGTSTEAVCKILTGA